MSRVHDLIVVGAGPAGSAAAIAALRARPDAGVLLLDTADFPRDKVCGDGIAPHALDVLDGLGVDTGALVAGTRPVTRLHLRSPGGRHARRSTARPAHVVPRQDFDARLLDVARAAGATVARHRVRTVRVGRDDVVVDGVLRARVVIGADGAESTVRRQVGAGRPRRGTVALALRGYADAAEFPEGEQLLTMTRLHWPAYAWVFPIGDGRANVGYGELVQDRVPTRAHLEQRLRALVPPGLVPDTLRGHRLPLSNGRPALAHGPVLLAGDAASLINPLTGEGIFYAVLSGAAAGAAAMAADPACAYRRALADALGAHFRQTDLLARLGRWPALLDLSVAAAARSQATFDTVVEIGLGAGRLGPADVTDLLRVAVSDRIRRPLAGAVAGPAGGER